ncbi:MAG: hypothetical protein WC843_00845 [Candidatus Gracilibacteria bacterium]
MTLFWIIIFVHLGSILFLIFCMQRALHYLKRYKLEENKYTKLFWVITLKHIIIIYVIVVLLFAAISSFYMYTLL